MRCVWRARGDTDGQFIDPANEYWGIAFTRAASGAQVATLIGPSIQARTLDWHAGDEHWGLELEVDVVLRGLAKGPLIGRLVDIQADDGWCEIGGLRISVPAYDGLEEFVERLARQGLLIGDPAIRAALGGGDPHYSERTMRRRFRATTGLGRKQIDQLRRAREAFALLQRGMRAAEVAATLGYTDQPHLTQSLRLLAGCTPAQILTDIEP